MLEEDGEREGGRSHGQSTLVLTYRWVSANSSLISQPRPLSVNLFTVSSVVSERLTPRPSSFSEKDLAPQTAGLLP